MYNFSFSARVFSRTAAAVLLLCLVAPAERTVQIVAEHRFASNEQADQKHEQGSEALAFNGKGMNAFQRMDSSRSHRRVQATEPSEVESGVAALEPSEVESGVAGPHPESGVAGPHQELPSEVAALDNAVTAQDTEAHNHMPPALTEDEFAAFPTMEAVRKAADDHHEDVEKHEEDALKIAAETTGHKDHDFYTDFLSKVMSVDVGNVHDLTHKASDVTLSNHKSGILSDKYAKDLMKLANATSQSYHRTASLNYEAFGQVHGALSNEQLDEEVPVEIVMPVEQVEFDPHNEGQLTAESKHYLSTVFLPEAKEKMKQFLSGDYHLTFCVQASTAIDPEELEAEEHTSHGKEDAMQATQHMISERNKALSTEVKEVMGSASGDKPEYDVAEAASGKNSSKANYPVSSVVVIAKKKKGNNQAKCPANTFDAVKTTQGLPESIGQIAKQEHADESIGKQLEHAEVEDEKNTDIATAQGGWGWLTRPQKHWAKVRVMVKEIVGKAQHWATEAMEEHKTIQTGGLAGGTATSQTVGAETNSMGGDATVGAETNPTGSTVHSASPQAEGTATLGADKNSMSGSAQSAPAQVGGTATLGAETNSKVAASI